MHQHHQQHHPQQQQKLQRLRSISLDPQQPTLKENTNQDVAGLLKLPGNVKPTPKPKPMKVSNIVPPQSTNIAIAPLAPASGITAAAEAVSALSVRDRIKSLNKSVSEDSVSSSVQTTHTSPYDPSSPSTQTKHLATGPFPYPRFSGERLPVSSQGNVRQISPRIIPSPQSSPTNKPQIDHQQSLQYNQVTSSKQQSNPISDITVEPTITVDPVSPTPRRKHSTDHVIFGSAVALPCRVYASSSRSPTSSTLFSTSPSLSPISPTCSSHPLSMSTFSPTYSSHQHTVSVFSPTQSSVQPVPVSPVIVSTNRKEKNQQGSNTGKQFSSQTNLPLKPAKTVPLMFHGAGKEQETDINSKNAGAREKLITNSKSKNGKCVSYSKHKENKAREIVKGRSGAHPIEEVPPSTPSDTFLAQVTKCTNTFTKTEETEHTCALDNVNDQSVSSSRTDSRNSLYKTCSSTHHNKHKDTITKGIVICDSHLEDADISSTALDITRVNIETVQNFQCEKTIYEETIKQDDRQFDISSMNTVDSNVDYQSLLSEQVASNEETQQQCVPLDQTGEHPKQQQRLRINKHDKHSLRKSPQENIESPDVYKPKLRYTEEANKTSQRQPISQVIFEMIHVSQEQPQSSVMVKEKMEHLQHQQHAHKRERRRRLIPPEHHQPKRTEGSSQHIAQYQYMDPQHNTKNFELKHVNNDNNENDEDANVHSLCAKDYLENKTDSRDLQRQHPDDHQYEQTSGIPEKQVIPKMTSTIFINRSLESQDANILLGIDVKPPQASLLSADTNYIPMKCESKEMQTDIVTTAEKGCDSFLFSSCGSEPNMKINLDNETLQQPQYGVSEISEQPDSRDMYAECSTQTCIPQTEMSADPHQAKTVIKVSSLKNKAKDVPPPSPTAMELLMEEVEEEGSDDEEFERREIEKAMKREVEMKSFTDKIYQRLSDLLCSPGEEDDGDNEVFEEEKEREKKTRCGKVYRQTSEEPMGGNNLDNTCDRYTNDSYHPGDEKSDNNYYEMNLGRDDSNRYSGATSSSTTRFSFESSGLSQSYHSSAPTRVLTIESSSSLTTTTSESESEPEEPPVIIFKPAPTQHSTEKELRRLRDYREDPQLPTLLRKAIISRNLGANLWDDGEHDDKSKHSKTLTGDDDVFTKTKSSNVFVFPERATAAEFTNTEELKIETSDIEEKMIAQSVPQQMNMPEPISSPHIHNLCHHNQHQDSYLRDFQHRRSSREYHSDDDVVSGRGVPDYYDDTKVWVASRRQHRPPVQFSQMSLAVVAQRRRERRERWLKKRRRNRTDLLGSTGGSSDTDRDSHYSGHAFTQQVKTPESTLERPITSKIQTRANMHGKSMDDQHARRPDTLMTRSIHRLSGSSIDQHEDYMDEALAKEQDPMNMGSGILTSPKYAKPILPMFLTGATRGVKGEDDFKNIQQKVVAPLTSDKTVCYKSVSRTEDTVTSTEHIHDPELNSPVTSQGLLQSPTCIPGIEETFNELKSVQNILEGLQDKRVDSRPPPRPTSKGSTSSHPTHLSPLTKENVRSLRDYGDKSGTFRRSRISLTDRTESDLDIYSERDLEEDSCSGSEYADDEGDGEDDNGDADEASYATADDDIDAIPRGRRPVSSLTITSDDIPAARGKSGEMSDESEMDYVVSCTFYNSSVYPSATATPTTSNNMNVLSTPTNNDNSSKFTNPETRPQTHINTDRIQPPATTVSNQTFTSQHQPSQSGQDTGGAGSNPPGSTFQSARHQMHDIQTHLQALRRQMEILPDDNDGDDGDNDNHR